MGKWFCVLRVRVSSDIPPTSPQSAWWLSLAPTGAHHSWACGGWAGTGCRGGKQVPGGMWAPSGAQSSGWCPGACRRAPRSSSASRVPRSQSRATDPFAAGGFPGRAGRSVEQSGQRVFLKCLELGAARYLSSLPVCSEALGCPERRVHFPRWACLQFGFRHFPISAWSALGLRRGAKEINACSSLRRSGGGCQGPRGAGPPRLLAAASPCGGPTRPVPVMINVPLLMCPH